MRPRWPSRQGMALILGPLLFGAVLLLAPTGLEWKARVVAALTVWMAVWWLMEAAPLAVTALLPLVVLPVLGAVSFGGLAAQYADSAIFLLLGGFLVASAIERWGLHRRFAAVVLARTGGRPWLVLGGVMFVTASLSGWISNTATAMLVLPVATSILSAYGEPKGGRFGTALLLGVAYSATIGGIGTLVGTAPNLIFAGAYRSLVGREVSFLEWMSYGLPLALLMWLGAWLYLAFVYARVGTKGTQVSQTMPSALAPGAWTREQVLVLGVFLTVALLWMTRPAWGGRWPAVTDAWIAMAGGITLFLLPARPGGRLLTGEAIKALPWDVVLLLGGGLALAHAFSATGLDTWLAQRLTVLGGLPPVLILGIVVAAIVFATELASNTAIASITLPVVGSMAVALGVEPFPLMIAVTFAASLAFMLPVGTPPNAIVFGTGYFTLPQMARVGWWMNLMGIAIITVYMALRWEAR
ncbi:MAG: SLC13 family permease [Dehalococcoidia bacterium]|nr:SLC13 family permease [Dehalococcoidia bacterium]MDW8119716.1 SLC13 family permease [Chloroflexota bacterium]